MKSYHVHIEGRVQGIGFRPFIYHLANKYRLSGTVSNTLDGVHIILSCELCEINNFIQEVKASAPSMSIITSVTVQQIEDKAFDGFSIVGSLDDGKPDLLITPDFAICETCADELYDPANRRYQYPFITCTSCGPRFSIETNLPYDRNRTSMKSFKMCDSCKAEYNDPLQSRFYAQTNSCSDCKIDLWLLDAHGKRVSISEDLLLDFVCQKIVDGLIVAIKGIGGFLLVCDATKDQTVTTLRKRKLRPSKPFALLYPDVLSVQQDFFLADIEKKELQGAAAPIILLKPRKNAQLVSKLHAIAPGLDRFGVMLPYAPILLLIAKKLNRPLLATSGNLKGSPIIFQNDEATNSLAEIADYFLLNDRDIQVPQDDSVLKFSKKYQQKIIIRRSRGYAPALLQNAVRTDFDKKVLSMGALLKSSFCLWKDGRCHVSQFLGDTLQLDAQVCYRHTLDHFMKLLKFTPEVIVMDKHPAYFSSLLGKELSASHQSEIVTIQHHEAHFWAVLAENDLLVSRDKILGVVFDGTGMGSDGAVWGGEFFSYQNQTMSRVQHFEYFPHILGDKMAREPRISALSLTYSTLERDAHSKVHFTQEEIDFYKKVLASSSLCTSSVGRIFDAVASLLNYCQINTYEGEAAMYLEVAAERFASSSTEVLASYSFTIAPDGRILYHEMLEEILRDLDTEVDRGKIAYRFHLTLVSIIEAIANLESVSAIAFSGGVFQNSLLLDLIIEQLGEKFTLYFHKLLSPNDENISYGQLAGYYMKDKSGVSSPQIFETNKKL